MRLSKSQIDKLGDRLKKGNITEADLRLLDQYRRSFTQAYETVINAVRNDLGLEPTGRPAKSTTSISDKLRRESIRLSQIQDIAGCRVVVENIEEQNRVVESFGVLFEHINIIDRRQRPSHGYRAVHVITNCQGKMIEIQVRTELQQLWAELSEKLADVEDPAIKYGGGNEDTQELLSLASRLVGEIELIEIELTRLSSEDRLVNSRKVTEQREEFNSLRERTFIILQKTINEADES